MSKSLHKIPRVLVALPTVQKASRDKFNGILKYAHKNGPWDVQILEDHPFIANLASFGTWKPDGVIRSSSCALPANNFEAEKLPTVIIDPAHPLPDHYSSVSHDSRRIAEIVADTYIDLGLMQFGFIGSIPDFDWSSRRSAAFTERLKQHGYDCNIYRAKDEADWGIEQTHMRKWLLKLPKPSGIMVAVDQRAKQVLDTCLAAGIRIPEDLAVFGVDNDETICENTTPTLSSVLPDFEGGGYQAAEILDNLMHKKLKQNINRTYGVKGIIQRQSSRYSPQHDNKCTASAYEFIRLKACEGISVTDVARHMNVSRRLAEIRFRKDYDQSILDAIQHRRLERVCTMLRDTELPIGEIGEQCGYETENYLKNLFKKRFGSTMSEYRKISRKQSR
ncbi:MAG: XylR family transcriptional regulator [Kiritimatiellae bacterium]|jgi:LacI family transcriptional regulator|nr:XylR family transcriptional regulator [Kiritimatiellia bacterium]